MATTCYFEEVIVDQDGNGKLEVEFGRSSYYSNCQLGNGKTGTDSIYLKVDDKGVIMDLETAKRFVEAVISVGHYHRLID
ncbi:hypothetical protein [Methylobacterium indicum]|jgi:hypothetical protein|uniref:hypothetical protein n=1 Tax=Methylobacterium indicum TaxID=1775910 RepID=UPI000652ED9B|nr:hypothetical protein [Methylobacterium indicum]